MRNTLTGGFVLLWACCWAALGAAADDAEKPAARGHRGQQTASVFNLAVPAHPYDVILARPEKNSVTSSVLTYQDLEGVVAYGTRSGTCASQTAVRQFKGGVPAEFVLDGLQADTRYYYQFRSRAVHAARFTDGAECTFHTARPPDSEFTFTLTADAHLDDRTSEEDGLTFFLVFFDRRELVQISVPASGQ
jgi:hypothetical protein